MQKLIKDKLLDLERLCRDYDVKTMHVFGSVCTDKFNDKSDIDISDSRRIVDLRNWVIHGYDKVDDMIIWGIVTRDIPKLKRQVKRLIDK